MAGLTLNKVSKQLGGATIIEDLDLEIRDREFMVLVGPSGCGKSTILRLIAGLEPVSGGTIAIRDTVVNGMPPQARDVAMVFQSYALFPHLTVRQNLEFGLKIRRTPKAERGRLVAEAAGILGLDALLGRKPGDLSGGERQRVALGRAMIRKPSVFLFDEPLSNLDARLRVRMRAEIKQLQARLETTSLYVTHDQVEAMTMGHRIAVLDRGRLQQVGTPLEVYEHPANVFVAGFLGAPPMNLLAATLSGDGTTIAGSGWTIPAPEFCRAAAGSGGRSIVAGIRPEAVFGPGRTAPAEAVRLEATAEMVETLGDEVIVYGGVGGDTWVFKAGAHSAPEPGARIDLRFALDSLHLFDRETGRRWTPDGTRGNPG